MHENKCARCGKWYRRGAFEGGNMCPQCRMGDEAKVVDFERSIPWEKGVRQPDLAWQGENIQITPALTVPECGT